MRDERWRRLSHYTYSTLADSAEHDFRTRLVVVDDWPEALAEAIVLT